MSANRAARVTAGQVVDPLLTVQETAEQLKSCTRTVRRRIADGSLPAVRVGPTQIRVRESDIEKLLRPIPSAVTRQAPVEDT